MDDAEYRKIHIPPDFVVDGSLQRVRAAHVLISRDTRCAVVIPTAK
jgi:hypothetical protein